MTKKPEIEIPPVGSSTHVRLFSGNVKNFNLERQIEQDQDMFRFGFTMKRGERPDLINTAFTSKEEEVEVSVYLDKEGLESLIHFLNRCCKDEK